MHTLMAHLGRCTDPHNTEFILSVDHFTWVGARNPGSLDILGQETLFRGFRDTVGYSVHCSLCCFLPQSFCQVMGLKRIWIVKQGTIHKLITDRLGEQQRGQTCQRTQSPCVLPVLHQVYTNTCRISASPALLTWASSILQAYLCAQAKPLPAASLFPGGENPTVVLVGFKLLSQWAIIYLLGNFYFFNQFLNLQLKPSETNVFIIII